MPLSLVDKNLHEACDRNDPYLVTKLLEQGANINSIDMKYHHRTPLIRATINNSYDIVLILLLYHSSTEPIDIFAFDDQGLNAFHWALIKGHVECISIMSLIHPQYLMKTDKCFRSPSFIFQSLKPLPHVIKFMRKWYPELFDTSETMKIINSDRNKLDLKGDTSFYFPFWNSSSDCHESDESDSDIEESYPSNLKRKSHKHQTKSTWRSSFSKYLTYLHFTRRDRGNSIVQNLLQCGSSLISKNSEELSKFPFRCFFGSILLSFYYVIFIFYPSSYHLEQPILYASNMILVMNLIGQLLMWSSFLITYYIGHYHISQMPDLCSKEYLFTLQKIVEYYSTKSTISSLGPPNVCHLCRLVLPLRAKHCKEINRCLLTFDHYCYFIWSPIFRQNYLYFFFYLVAMVTYIPLFLVTSISYIRYHKPSSRILAYFLIWCFIQWIFVLSLLYYMIQSISLGQTTCERIKNPPYVRKKKKNPFSSGSWWGNIMKYRLEMCNYTTGDYSATRDELRQRCHIYFHVEDIPEGRL